MALIDIRAATPDDAAAVEDYHHRRFTDTYAAQRRAGDFGLPDREGIRQQLEPWFEPGSGFETNVDGVPVGHCTVSGQQIVHLFVEPDHQHNGVGRRLLS